MSSSSPSSNESWVFFLCTLRLFSLCFLWLSHYFRDKWCDYRKRLLFACGWRRTFTQGPFASVGGVFLHSSAWLNYDPEDFQALIIENNLESSERPAGTLQYLACEAPLRPLLRPLCCSNNKWSPLFSVVSLSRWIIDGIDWVWCRLLLGTGRYDYSPFNYTKLLITIQAESLSYGRKTRGGSDWRSLAEMDKLGILTRNEAHRPLNILLKSLFKNL